MTSIATDSWEEQATEIRFSRKVREILFCWLSLAFRESDIGGRGPCLYNRATRGCAAPPAGSSRSNSLNVRETPIIRIIRRSSRPQRTLGRRSRSEDRRHPGDGLGPTPTRVGAVRVYWNRLKAAQVVATLPFGSTARRSSVISEVTSSGSSARS